MRDRLIALLEVFVTKSNNCTTLALADYLLANGVIAPPCKVGDTLYAISDTRVKDVEIVEIYVGKDNCISFQASFDCDEDCEGCPFESWSQSYCGEWDCGGQYGDTMIVANDFGKTVFLTREEAEAALAERSKE